jgi:thiosulfate dehydrogenase [quinone] large subunit
MKLTQQITRILYSPDCVAPPTGDNERIDEGGFDPPTAHGLARLTLGLNIAMHGYGRFPALGPFADELVQQFANTFLASSLIYITGIGIAIGEAVIGTLLVFGLFQRSALLFGTLLMLLLIFGSTLVQQWQDVSMRREESRFIGASCTTRRPGSGQRSRSDPSGDNRRGRR